jgi:PAS domain S-box-containing protein
MERHENFQSDQGESIDFHAEYASLKEQYERDITNLNRVIDEMKESYEKYRLAYITSPDAINITRIEDGKYISVNEGFTKILGYTEAEAIGRTSVEMNIWLDPEERLEFIQRVSAEKSVKNFETKFLTRDRKIVNGLVSASLIELDGGPHILSVTRDISVRKKAEEALAQEQFLISALMNNLTDHVYFKDLNSKFIRTNKSHALSFGLANPDEVIGKSDFDFFTPEAARSAFEDEQTIIKTGQPILKEEKLTRKDNSDAWFSVIKMPLRDANGSIIGTFGISRDITLHRKAQDQIFLLANALKSINECVTITDIDDKVIFLNKAFVDTYGFDEKDLAKAPISLIRSPKNPPELVNEIMPATLLGGWKGELLNVRKDGTEFPVFLSTAAVKNSAGEPVALIGVAKDITETKKTEAALKQSEEKFRSLAHSANDAIITTNSSGVIQGWNNGAEHIFGYSESEIFGKPLSLIMPSEYLSVHLDALRRVEAGGESHVIGKTLELEGLNKSGLVFPIELSLSEWQTSEGRFFTGIVRDISGRKRTELENQVLFEITQGITSTSNLDELLLLIHKSLGKVVYANNFFVALYDRKNEQFTFPYFVDQIDSTPLPVSMGKSCTSYVYNTVKPLVLTQEIFDQLVEEGEVELVGSNSPSWIGIPLQTPSKVIGVLVLQHYEKENVYTEKDVNFLVSIGSQIAVAIERKKAEEEINLKNEQLLMINAEKDKFFSIIAHDLRSPLSAFVGATQILTEDLQILAPEEIMAITLSMKTSASNIYALLKNLLEWSRIKGGGVDFVSTKLKLKENIEPSVNVFSEAAKKKDIVIETIIAEDLEVLADRHMLETVTRNLVSNAIKFSNMGGRVRISARKSGDGIIEVSVKDSGIGMPPELVTKLFLMNEKTSRNGTGGELSSGLGLLLCKEFIEKSGGTIWAESTDGNGSTFFFTLKESK